MTVFAMGFGMAAAVTRAIDAAPREPMASERPWGVR
jgi:hypothetical protein